MSLGGGGWSSNESQSGPWAGAQKKLIDLYNQAQTQGKKPLEYYSDSTVAPESQYTQQWRQGVADRQGAGSPALQAAQDYTTQAARGDFLQENASRDAAWQTAARSAQIPLREGVPGPSERQILRIDQFKHMSWSPAATAWRSNSRSTPSSDRFSICPKTAKQR